MIENSSFDLSDSLIIGNVQVRNRAFLAPMSGVTDVPFRKLAWDFGAGLVFSEMVASQALVEGDDEMHLKLCATDAPLHVVQLAGREAKWMALAAKMAQEKGAQIVDINMGCPAKRVTTGFSGSALMRDLDHALTLIEAVVKSVGIPVTLKMRLGWDHQTINAPELAKRAENAGIQMITVHGRTRCQFYKGNADWFAVRAVKEAIKIPLVINGDIVDHDSAEMAIADSNADAVMIGRGAYGAPWLPGKIGGSQKADFLPDAEMVRSHHEAMLSFYGLASGIRQARKHLGWYLEQLPKSIVAAEQKIKLMTSLDPAEVHCAISQIFPTSKTLAHSEKTAA